MIESTFLKQSMLRKEGDQKSVMFFIIDIS